MKAGLQRVPSLMLSLIHIYCNHLRKQLCNYQNASFPLVSRKSSLLYRACVRKHLFATTPRDSATAIQDMWVRGAPLIGVVAAYGIALGMNHDASDMGLQLSLIHISVISAGGGQSLQGQAVNTTLNGGEQWVHEGGIATGTVINEKLSLIHI